MTAKLNSPLVGQLTRAVAGRVIGPDDAGYDDARTIFYGGFDRRPAAVVRPGGSADVAAVVKIAADTDTELAIRSGGHSIAGHSVSEGGIVLDMGSMKALEIDPESRTAWAETGLTAGEYTNAAGDHGLATSFGDTGSVGIGGITLAGGIGFLARKHGLTVDHVLGAEIVTADGRILEIDEHDHPDLFWAIRGGGGNFGVVTRIKYRLHPVEQVVGGMLILPATAETISRFLEAAESAPDELTTILNVMSSAPMPLPLPEEAEGKPLIMAMLAYAGDVEAGEQTVAPFRTLADPIMDTIGAIEYRAMYQPEEEDFHPLSVGRIHFVDSIESDFVADALERLRTSTAMFSVMQFRVLGGAIAKVSVDATAFAHRDRPYMAAVASIFEDAADTDAQVEWVESFASTFDTGRPGAYVGFLADEGEDRIRSAYPNGAFERLADVKAKYDPTNLFRLNQNIKPAG